MRILFFYPGLYPHIGGLSTHMKVMGEGLELLGNHVDYFTYSSLPIIVQIIFFDIPLFFINKLSGGFGEIYYLFISELIFGIGIIFKLLFNKYDVINSHSLKASNIMFIVKKIFKLPVILTVHSYPTYELVSNKTIKKGSLIYKVIFWNEKRSYYCFSKIITVDIRLKNYIISCGVPEDKINVLFNFVDINVFKPRRNKKKFREEFNLPNNRILILCPRRLVEKNGVIYPAMACVHLKKVFKNFLLIYAGEGNQKRDINRIINKYGLEKYIKFLDNVNHKFIHKLYNSCDIVVIPSINSGDLEEATSISALESMASGLPVVASRIGGLNDIITDRVNGLLVDEKDEKQLFEAILLIINNEKLNHDLCKNSIESIKNNFSHINRASEFVKILKNLN